MANYSVRGATSRESSIQVLGPIHGDLVLPAGSQTGLTLHGTNDMYQTLSTLHWPDPHVVRNRLMENKDALRQEAIEWIFQDEQQFVSWLNDVDKRFLWIKGGAGKGKTMMTIGITERISSASDNSVLVAYFFCQNADSQLNTVAGILKGLILRLMSQQEDLKDSLQRRWDCKNQQFIEDMNVWQTLWDVLLEMLDRCRSRKVYIVIDALDECEDKDMADFLGRVIRRGLYQPRVKWLLTSRPLDSAEQKLLTGPDWTKLGAQFGTCCSRSASLHRFQNFRARSNETLRRGYLPTTQR
jgi:hypothetical protein